MGTISRHPDPAGASIEERLGPYGVLSIVLTVLSVLMLVTTARRHHGGDDVGMIDFPFALARLLLEGFLWIGAVSLSVANVRHVSNARFRLRTWLLCGAVFLPPAIVVWRVITY